MSETLDEILYDRANLIAHACAPHIGNKPQWWGGYKRKEALNCVRWTDSEVDYRRSAAKSACIHFTNVQGQNLKNVQESEPVELDSEIIDAAAIRIYNSLGESPQPWGPYVGEFERTKSKEDSFENTFTQAIEVFYEQGGEAAGYKAGIKLSLGFSQSLSGTEGQSDRVSRSFSFNGTTPIGLDERITAWRRVARVRSTITGEGDYEHKIKIGKHWHGRWLGGNNSWDSFSDFMRCLKGDAPTTYDLANAFRDSPPPNWLITALENPLDKPYTQTMDFEDATAVDLRKVTIGVGIQFDEDDPSEDDVDDVA